MFLNSLFNEIPQGNLSKIWRSSGLLNMICSTNKATAKNLLKIFSGCVMCRTAILLKPNLIKINFRIARYFLTFSCLQYWIDQLNYPQEFQLKHWASLGTTNILCWLSWYQYQPFFSNDEMVLLTDRPLFFFWWTPKQRYYLQFPS